MNNPLDVLELAAPPEQVDQAFRAWKAGRRRQAGDDFDAHTPALLGSLLSAGAPVEVVGAATSASALGTSSGSTATRAPIRLSLVSGPSPFASNPDNYVNAEVEPRVAVNPTNPTNIVGGWQQDRYSEGGGAHGLVTAVSLDGGRSWTRTWAHFTLGSGGNTTNGGDYERASDPWYTFAPNGDVYQSAIAFNVTDSTNAVLVSKSTDGGNTWSEPVTLIREASPDSFNDKESITADPFNANFVYAVWDRSYFPSENVTGSSAHRSEALFSRTTDGGRTWEQPRVIFNTSSGQKNQFAYGNQIVALPDGTLLDIFDYTQGNSGKWYETVIRSTDRGATWSGPITIAQDLSVGTRDPDTGTGIRSDAGTPQIAVDLSNGPGRGTVYAAWSDARFGGVHNDIVLSKSTDGGLHWTTPVQINQTPDGVAAFTPTVAVAADGTVGVTYYDFRNNTSSPGALTDYWLAYSRDQGASWSESRVTSASFDIEWAPTVPESYFLGDYQGLAAAGNDFVPFFVQANTGDTANRTDVFATTIQPA